MRTLLFTPRQSDAGIFSVSVLKTTKSRSELDPSVNPFRKTHLAARIPRIRKLPAFQAINERIAVSVFPPAQQ